MKPYTSSHSGTKLSRLALALALALTGLVGAASAQQTVTYDIRGTVTQSLGFEGTGSIWSKASAGDPFRIVYTVDADSIGTPGNGTIYSNPVLAVDIDFNGVTSSTLTASSMQVVDDGLPNCSDLVLLQAFGTDYGTLTLRLQAGPSVCCPTTISSEVLPLALDLTDWSSRSLDLLDGLGGLFCTVESILVSTSLIPPENDDLSDAAPIGPGLTAFDTTLATTDGDALDPGVCDMGPFGSEQIHQDVWYRFTPPVSDDWQITTTGLAGFDTRLAVYDPSLAVGPATIHHEYRGTIAVEVAPLTGIWSGAQVGTPYTVTFELDANAVGVDSPGLPLRTWSDLVLNHEVTIGAVSDSSPVTSSATELWDDFSTSPCRDETNTSVTTAGYTYNFQLREDAIPGCCPDVFQSFDLPTTLDLSDFTGPTLGVIAQDTSFVALGIDELVVSEGPFGPGGDPLAVIACNDNEDAFPPNEAGVTVALTAGTEYVIRLGSFNAGTGGGAGELLVRVAPDPTTFCNDGDFSLAACPCGNPGDPDTGCDIQQGTGGVGLDIIAQETSPQNRATLIGSGFPPNSVPAAIVIRGTDLHSASPVVFGDGLRCTGSPIVRLAATFAVAGISNHTFGHGAMAGSGSFYYQLWFRNTPIMFCDPAAAFNLSSGRILDW